VLGALRELGTRDQAIMRQWQMRLERAEYEAALAERRYEEVDPSNRLVASTLERRRNDALLQVQDLKKQAAEFQQQQALVAPEQKEKIMALAGTCRAWGRVPSTQPKDCKRMLRLLIKDQGHHCRKVNCPSSFWFTSGCYRSCCGCTQQKCRFAYRGREEAIGQISSIPAKSKPLWG
jgi:hypothetical protein